MLDVNLPTYTHQPSANNPLDSILYLTHNGSEPSPEYLLKRPARSDARGRFALGLFDVRCPSVVYAEVLVKAEWTSPNLSASELSAHGGISPTRTSFVPDTFDIMLYNPDQRITVRHNHGSWGKSETWEFEVPERSFRIPSASEMDRDSTLLVSDLAPRVVFRWKRDGRLSRDMSCYMCGWSMDGKKSKEPDITVAMFRAAKNGSIVTVYEPNMARVPVEDRKGLEVALILGAEVVRDLYLVPKHDPFNTGGAGGSKLPGRISPPSSSQQQSVLPNRPGRSASASAAGALGLGILPPGQQQQQQQGHGRASSSVDAETKMLQAIVAEENRLAQAREAREREKRDREEQDRIRKMLQQEEDVRRRRREAEVERETERLRKQYGVQLSPPPAPPLPPRPNSNPQNQHHYVSGALGWGQPPAPPPPQQQQQQQQQAAMPPRPNSAEPSSSSYHAGNAASEPNKKHSNRLSALLGPYSGSSGVRVSGFFHRLDGDKRKKVERKRSL
ncbi:hypothetical protein E4U43_001942 [Claviceps pusilla]|uniref:Uncharacterized protein n=1 Tax=Claviceps pusilla TaxID=123648 RepID=A0A9P7N9D1_9HYPO|nr:hypothetical protein E4U43_001942 [Claviceps pusilla]